MKAVVILMFVSVLVGVHCVAVPQFARDPFQALAGDLAASTHLLMAESLAQTAAQQQRVQNDARDIRRRTASVNASGSRNSADGFSASSGARSSSTGNQSGSASASASFNNGGGNRGNRVSVFAAADGVSTERPSRRNRPTRRNMWTNNTPSPARSSN